jgi:hypothetical protein
MIKRKMDKPNSQRNIVAGLLNPVRRNDLDLIKYCDFYAYGNVESMKDYCNLYNYYDYYNEKYREINLHSYEKNKKYIKISQDGDYKFLGNDGHISSLYYYYCSYPERMLNLHLKEYMLVESKEISIKLVR